MSKIILAIFLIFIEILPAGHSKSFLEENIRSRIDGTSGTETVEQSARNYNVVERAGELTDISARAEAAYFVDLGSGQILVDKNSETKLPMASLTKLMTAMIVIEKADMNELVTVPANETRFGDSTMGLYTGDSLTVYNLLQGLLINSGSDAALTLAKHVSGNPNVFVALMNERARTLGLAKTQFTNPVGWDEPGHYSTAHDMASLTTIALRNPSIREIVAKKTTKVVSAKGRNYLLVNTNLLLGNRFLGAKTGTTYGAGECLASYYRDDDTEIVGVVLNSPSRFLETEELINKIKEGFIFDSE